MSVPANPRRSDDGIHQDYLDPATPVRSRSLAVWLLTVPILAYRWLISPVLGPRCRYLPSCSEYAILALARHGALWGSYLALRRFSRCHPFGGHGFDPVPDAARDAGPAVSSCHDCRR